MATVTSPSDRPARRRRRVRSRRVGVAVLVICGAAAAGVQLVDGDGEPYAWDLDTPQPNVVSAKVTYFLDSRGTTDIVSGPLSDLAAARAGIAAWEIGTSRLRFTEDGTRPAGGHVGTDRVNYVGWASSGIGRLTLAITFPTRSGSEILDMDVLFNDRDFTWDTRTPGTSGVADIAAIMTHEWGHAVGADHVPLRASTMYFASSTGSTAFRSLAADDRALIGSVYPNDTFRQTTGTLRGRITRDGASDHRAIHVVAVSLVTGEPAASTLTAPDGTFEMRGLPRGVYRVIAAPTVPLGGAMNAFWATGSVKFLPSVLRASDENPAAAVSVVIRPDTVTVAPEFTVRDAATPFEFDDSLSSATLLELGDAVAARLESGGDVDWFALDANGGQKVTIAVLAWHLGSKADPALALTTAQGVTITKLADVRSEAFFETRTEGPDLDARLIAVEIPGTGRYYVQVRNQAPGSSDDSFYVLFVTPASEAPSAALSTVDLFPARLDADGTAQTTLSVVALKGTGEPVGAGALVELAHDGAGAAPTTALDIDGDGTFTALVTAPTTPGRDRFTVTITTSDGIATLADAALVVYLGPADAGTTTLDVLPRRIAMDGEDEARVTLRPRDANGELLGAGRAVAFAVTGPTGATVGIADDVGGGAYEATVTAGLVQGAADVTATVDGVALGPVGTVHVGFPLGAVAAQAAADAATMQALSGLKRQAVSALRAVVKQAAGIADALAAGNEKKAVKRARRALDKLVRAEKKAKGLLPALGTTTELAAAIRQAAAARIDQAVVGGGKDQRRLDTAREHLREGDAFLAAGVPKKAAARYERAYRKALALQP